MTKDIAQANYEAYLSSYSIAEKDERRRLLRSLVTEDVVSLLPNRESHGIQELTAHVEDFETQRPGAYFTLNAFSFHHNQFLAEVGLHAADGAKLATARTYGKVTDEGLFTSFVGFF